MKLVLISDTHGRHTKLNVPDGDVLIHAGDFTNLGEESGVIAFNEWLGSLPHQRKVVIAGNHEMHWTNEKRALLTNCTYLHDSGCEIGGLKFWGSPFTPAFLDWNFGLKRGLTSLAKWLTIPHGTDILVTHGPPKGILDQPTPRSEPLGCFDLALVVESIAPKLHVFGHIHGGYGHRAWKNTEYVNAASCNESYHPVNKPVVVEL